VKLSPKMIIKGYAYAWLTLGFFLVSLGLHWWFGWSAFVDEAREHGQSPEVGQYLTVMFRDTFENWQSEFLQLLWQVGGLAYFLYLGSPASKENDDRTEIKIDAILRAIGGDKADELIKKIDKEYERDTGHTPHNHGSALAKNAGKELAKG
jgi:hypothetical protein